jgi:hypothetical protein
MRGNHDEHNPKKDVLITGANVGIGKDIARQMPLRPEIAHVYQFVDPPQSKPRRCSACSCWVTRAPDGATTNQTPPLELSPWPLYVPAVGSAT